MYVFICITFNYNEHCLTFTIMLLISFNQKRGLWGKFSFSFLVFSMTGFLTKVYTITRQLGRELPSALGKWVLAARKQPSGKTCPRTSLRGPPTGNDCLWDRSETGLSLAQRPAGFSEGTPRAGGSRRTVSTSYKRAGDRWRMKALCSVTCLGESIQEGRVIQLGKWDLFCRNSFGQVQWIIL